MNGGLHMYFGSVVKKDGVELKAVVLVATTYLLLAAVFLSGMM
ncbi:hypothetical protein [Archangium violaceum]|nr:hypothetical protein [Archangium violaceum]